MSNFRLFSIGGSIGVVMAIGGDVLLGGFVQNFAGVAGLLACIALCGFGMVAIHGDQK